MDDAGRAPIARAGWRLQPSLPPQHRRSRLFYCLLPTDETVEAVICGGDRLFFLQLDRWFFPSKGNDDHPARDVVRWHRAGFRRYWRCKSRNPGGRPPMLWGAPRIRGELLKLGFAVAQSTVAKYRTDGRPSGQRWGTFLRNHLPKIAAMDLLVVPTIGFNLLYVLVLVRLARRELVWINVTASDAGRRKPVALSDQDSQRFSSLMRIIPTPPTESAYIRAGNSVW